MVKLEALNCAECPLSVTGGMCSAVALRSLHQLSRLGYDTTSDTRTATTIVTDLSAKDPEVLAAAKLECTLRLGQLASTQSGYAAVVY